MIAKRLIALVLAFGVAGTAGAAQLYRWVDEQGNVHYTQQPPAPSSAKKVEEKKLGDKPPTDRQLPYATQVAMKAHPVTLFLGDGCEPCTLGRDLLRKRGVPFTEIVVRSEESVRKLREVTGQLTVPVLKVGASTILRGYEETGWNNALDAAGYPKSGPPIPEQAAKPAAPAAPPPPPPPAEGTEAPPESAPPEGTPPEGTPPAGRY